MVYPWRGVSLGPEVANAFNMVVEISKGFKIKYAMEFYGKKFP